MNNFKPNQNFIFYLYWICERMDIFWKRHNNEQPPYTSDEILSTKKFTNVYKSLDRVTQYEFRNVIYNGKQYSKLDMFHRILIFKHFNTGDTWELLLKEFGDITFDVSLLDIGNFLAKYQEENGDFKPYNNAYMLTAAFLKGNKCQYTKLKGNGWKKYQYYFHIYQKEIYDSGFIDDIFLSKSLSELFENLVSITGIANFLAYQYIIDFNYSELFNFDENTFANAGLGTVRGIDRTFDFTGKRDYEAVIFWVQQNFQELLEYYSNMYDMNLSFKPLPNRMPTNVDLSNCFCETDKFMRGLGINNDGVHGKRIKNSFSQSSKGNIDYVFPPKWRVKSL